METRIFNRTVTVSSSDCRHSETFGQGERVRNIQRVGTGVLFEPVLTTHVAGTYVMELGKFETFTDAVQEARNAR